MSRARLPAARLDLERDPGTRRARGLFGSLLALLAVGCGTDGPLDSVSTRDSAGIRITVSHEPAWPAGTEWQMAPSPKLEIGAVIGRPEEELGRVSGAVRLSDGRIVLAEGQRRRLLFYDASGVLQKHGFRSRRSVPTTCSACGAESSTSNACVCTGWSSPEGAARPVPSSSAS